MYIRDLLRFSIKGLLSKKSRFSLTVISIFIGIVSVVVISAIGSSGQVAVNNELNNLGLNGASLKAKKYNLKTDDATSVKEFLGDDYYVTSLSKNSGMVKYKSQNFNSIVLGGEKDILDTLNLKIIYGRGIRDKDVLENKSIAVITKSVSEKIFGTDNSVGKKISIETDVKLLDFTVAGVADNSEIYDMISENMPVYIYIPSSIFKELYSSSSISEISVVGKEKNDIEDVCDRLISFLEHKNNEYNNYYYQNLNTYKKSISDIVDIVAFIVTFIGAVSLVVGGISVMNTMLITVNERKKEIGLKKAIGFTNISIMAEFLLESLIIIFISCILGVVSGIFIAYILVNLYGISLRVDFSSLIKSVIFSFITGGVFGIYPAYKAAYTDPIESLRR